MRCGSCGFENQPGAQFCEDCGTKLVSACPSCGREVRPTAKFCPACGRALTGQSAAPAKSRKRTGVARTKTAARPAASPAAAKSRPATPEAERRQLTVMFCDLVDSTQLSAQLDPEDYRTVVQQYQQTCTEVIQRHEGYLAQYLGDGLLVYFGYPIAHEDDARRAVRTGLEIVEALKGQAGPHALQVRIGVHTGLVVVGDIGAGSRTEQLALGETPNVAARVQGLAEPNTVVVSAATHRLIHSQFECQPFGSHPVKGIAAPIAIYHVQSERPLGGQLAGKAALTPLVGREQEVGLLLDRWEQAKEGRGQVVLLSGEPGIGKSRLAYTLREHVTKEGSLLFEARCSPYHQHSAFYPLVDVLQRTLLLTRQDTDAEKVAKLERALALYDLREALPLFTAVFSLPTPAQYPPLTLTPQKQKERTLQVLLQLLMAQAERQATVFVWEDVHWADPSSLELLGLLVEQLPTTKLLLVLTFRPEFTPPWKPRSHLSQLVLNRLGKRHVEAMIAKVAAAETLSAAAIEQIRIKTDGVPLFVEELTKSVVETLGAPGREAHHPLAIPATLQEALLARLDRLSSARQVAQLGATLGREFSYELLQAVAPLSAADLHATLGKLVDAEILYQRGVGPQTRYVFKHALIQDTAYHSLLKSTRQQYHRQIAQELEARFPDRTGTQPELLAHHYTEAGLSEQAVPYWQQAGERAARGCANTEAISHLTKGLAVLATLPNTRARAHQELALQAGLGPVLMAVKGWTAPETEAVYKRARELCEQIGETPQLFPILYGECTVYAVRPELRTLRELAMSFLLLAQRHQDVGACIEGSFLAGYAAFYLADLPAARAHLEQAMTLYGPQPRPELAAQYGHDGGISSQIFAAFTLWLLGYPEQSRLRVLETGGLAQRIAHPFTLAYAYGTSMVHQLRRDTARVREQAEAGILLAQEHGFPQLLGFSQAMHGWALAEEGQGEAGIERLRQGAACWHAQGSELYRPYWLALLAQAYGKVGRAEEGLATLAEALSIVERTQEVFYEAELYRLKGELIVHTHGSVLPSGAEAEACFHTAIEIARKQQAKSLELRAVTSLSRLWQRQGKQPEAHNLLSEVYGWFTEGFDTKDLQDAKALLDDLAEGV
jgi:class 3 adenylate cyclase/predicted ATPase